MTDLDKTTKERFIRLSQANDLPIKKSTLYKWSADNKYPQIFSQIDGKVFVDLEAIYKLLEENKRGE